jgi:hypothetical protein
MFAGVFGTYEECTTLKRGVTYTTEAPVRYQDSTFAANTLFQMSAGHVVLLQRGPQASRLLATCLSVVTYSRTICFRRLPMHTGLLLKPYATQSPHETEP